MKIDLSISEIWDLLKEGSTNQKDFIESLRYSEFEEFLEEHQMFFEEYDIRSLINGGCLFVEDNFEDVEEDYVIYGNGRVTISLY